MMIMITKPGAKLKKLAVAGAFALLLGVAVPLGYTTLADAGAMSLFAAGDMVADNVADTPQASQPEEPEEPEEPKPGIWHAVRQVVFGDTPQVIPY